MQEKLKKFLKDLFTEADNHTYDLVKLLALVAIINGLYLASYSVIVKDVPFNFQDFGTGVGLTFAGIAAALGLKKETPNA